MKIHVWGCIGYNFRCLYISKSGERFNGDAFVTMLENIKFTELCWANHRLAMDNATIHTCLKTQLFFVENEIQLLELRPNSPNLNPIEHVWRGSAIGMSLRLFWPRSGVI